MKTVFFSKDAQFELTDDEFKSAITAFDNGKRVYIARLEVSLSPNYLWAGSKPSDNNKRTLKDGTRVIKKFDIWYLKNMPDVKVDLEYYPELKETPEIKDSNKFLPASDIAKKLSDKIE
jgi:hypothetical protein